MIPLEEKIVKFDYEDGHSYFVTRISPFIGILILLFALVFFILIDFYKNWEFVLFILIGSVSTLLGFYKYPSVEFMDNKIKLRSPLNYLTVDFQDITKIVFKEKAPMTSYVRLDINTLPFLYKLIGFVYGSKGQSSILIRADINKFDQLIKILVDKTSIRMAR